MPWSRGDARGLAGADRGRSKSAAACALGLSEHARSGSVSSCRSSKSQSRESALYAWAKIGPWFLAHGFFPAFFQKVYKICRLTFSMPPTEGIFVAWGAGALSKDMF